MAVATCWSSRHVALERLQALPDSLKPDQIGLGLATNFVGREQGHGEGRTAMPARPGPAMANV